MIEITAEDIIGLIQQTIVKWHKDSSERDADYVIVTDKIRKIRPINEHRSNIHLVIQELAETNTEMWHEEDKVRSMKDDVVLKAIRNINPLNQHRNDLIEEIDEIMSENVQHKQEEENGNDWKLN